jgi:hypothetical protein
VCNLIEPAGARTHGPVVLRFFWPAGYFFPACTDEADTFGAHSSQPTDWALWTDEADTFGATNRTITKSIFVCTLKSNPFSLTCLSGKGENFVIDSTRKFKRRLPETAKWRRIHWSELRKQPSAGEIGWTHWSTQYEHQAHHMQLNFARRLTPQLGSVYYYIYFFDSSSYLIAWLELTLIAERVAQTHYKGSESDRPSRPSDGSNANDS